MATDREIITAMGSEPPLMAGGNRAPDRRDVSLRWLSGTFLTGITSSILMGVALFAALNGHEQLAIPGQALASTGGGTSDGRAERGGRLSPPAISAKPTDKTIMNVSTIVHEGDVDVVKKKPFALLKMSLARNHATQIDYPKFNPLKIVATGKTNPAPATDTGVIYGAQVDSEVSLHTVDFPLDTGKRAYAGSLGTDEVERMVRADSSELSSPTMQLASLYLPPPPAPEKSPFAHIDARGNARVTAENVSIAPMDDNDSTEAVFVDDVIALRDNRSIANIFSTNGFDEAETGDLVSALKRALGTDDLSNGTVLRLGIEQSADTVRIVRASVYENGKHSVTVARSDRGRFVLGSAPPLSDAVRTAFDDTPVPTIVPRNLPDIYDGIYRASLSYGMSKPMIAEIVRLLASKVDFQASMKPTDSLEVFFSAPDEDGKATPDSQLLFLDAMIDGKSIRLYRFQDPHTGKVDYYDGDGKNLRPFLLRNPVPNGVFTSPFGMRLHPILGYKRMHWGVDWAAPRGTPILSVGDGVIVKAGWDSGGYGNQTIIRYGNGYESSFNHQSAIAKGIKRGVHVRQGQVVGYIGATGEATGPHLHYEVFVNGTRVDPMKVRLPERKPLKDENLATFEHERKRIDALIQTNDDEKSSKVASR